MDTHWQETQLLLSVWLVSHHVKLVLSLSTTVSAVIKDFISKVGSAYPRPTLDISLKFPLCMLQLQVQIFKPF